MSEPTYEILGPVPIVQDITIVQGATYSAYFPWVEGDVAQSLEGFTAKISIARRRGRAGVAPILEATSLQNKVLLEPPDGLDVPQPGIVWVRLGPEDTELLVRSPLVYDLILLDNSDPTEVIRLYEGVVTVDLQASELE